MEAALMREPCPSSCLGKVHAAKQILEARVGAQAVEPGINFQKYHPCSALPVGHFQPTKCFVCVAQGYVDLGHKIRCYVALLRKLLQLLQGVLGFVPVCGRGIRGSKKADKRRSTVRELNRCSRGSDGALMHRLCTKCVR